MSLWEMSCSGAVMIVVIVAIRAPAINRLPKKTFLALWGVALARLLIPYSLPSVFSAYTLAERLTPKADVSAAPAAPLIRAAVTADAAHAVPLAEAQAAAASAPAAGPWTVVWLAGAAVCAAFFAAAYGKCSREFRESLPVESGFVKDWLASHRLRRAMEVRQSDKISAPLTYGVLRPVILMPKRTDWEDETALAYVLAHEYVHIRRFDVMAKLLLAAAVCVHWFNPAVWLLYVLANRDLELSCDEAVIRRFGANARSAYAMTLIRMEETRSGLTPLCNHFSKNAIEERIVAIMKIKKTSVLSLVLALALVVGVTTAFATSAQTIVTDPVKTLADSLRYADGTVSFQAPLNTEAGAINVRVYGRAEYDGGFSRSIHALDDVEILPGETYCVAYDPAYTEWGMEILYQEQSCTVDLLSLIEKEDAADPIQTVVPDYTEMSYIDQEEFDAASGWDDVDVILEAENSAAQGFGGEAEAAFSWPVPDYAEVTTGIADRVDPASGAEHVHSGEDIAAPEGAQVVAALAGTVSDTGFDAQRGNYVLLAHDEGKTSLYAHLKDVTVSQGEQVAQGGAIGTVGSSGMSTGPHLHFALSNADGEVEALLSSPALER